MIAPDERYDGRARPTHAELTIIGEVLTEWSDLEFWLQVIFRRLANIDFDASLALFGNIRNWRVITDTLRDLAQQRMAEPDIRAFGKLLARFDSCALRRNKIVHATWYQDRRSGEWCRYVVPSNSRKINAVLSKPIDQKLRARHLTSPKEMRQFCADARKLQDDITRFWSKWNEKQNPS